MNWQIASVIVSMVALLISVVTGVLNTRKADRKELEAKTEEVVRAEFRVHAAEFKAITTELATLVRLARERLDKGDALFHEQAERQQAMELSAVERMAELHKEFATKRELKEVGERLNEVRMSLAVFEQKLESR